MGAGQPTTEADEGRRGSGGEASPHAEARLARRGWPTWKGDLVFAAAVGALFALLVVQLFPDLLSGHLVETDSYMRLVRVRTLAQSGHWFDSTIGRSNAPFGATLHWTRPLDVILLVGAWLARPFLGFRGALHLSGVLVSPLLLIAVCFATAWAVRPLTGRRVRYLAMLCVLAQVGIMGYAMPGRADHNMLLLLAFVAMYGSAIRMLLDPRARWSGWATGLWAGFGLWVSPEFLAALFVVLATLVGLWAARGAIAHRARSMAFGFLAMTALAVALEHPPGALLVAEYDRVSVVHLLVAAVVAVFWITAASPTARRLGARGRTLQAVVGSAVAAGVVLAVYPRFFGGPMVDVNPELKRTWLPFLTEFQPYLVPHGLAGVGRVIAYLGAALLAGVVVVRGVLTHQRTRLLDVWVLLGSGLLAFVPLGIRWVRFVPYAEILGVIGTAYLLDGALRRLELDPPGARRTMARVLSTVGLVAGPLVLGAAVMAAGGESGTSARRAASTQVARCSADALVSALNDPAILGDRPRTVLAHVDLGPLLLYRTADSVVATPYHRNWQGILDWQRVMDTRDPEEARRIVMARGIDVVVACGGASPQATEPPTGGARFGDLLRTGPVPEWLGRVSVPGDPPGLIIYEVKGARGASGPGSPAASPR